MISAHWRFSAGKPLRQRLWLFVIDWCDARYHGSLYRWQSGFWSGAVLDLCDAYRDRFNENPLLTSG